MYFFLYSPTDRYSPPAIHYHSSLPSRPHYGRNEQKITTKTEDRGKDYPSCREDVGAEGFIGGCEGEGENGLWTVDTVAPPLSEVRTKIKMASHCVVPSFLALASSHRSPLNAHRSSAHRSFTPGCRRRLHCHRHRRRAPDQAGWWPCC